jgi:methyltransferase (TIGR00027 family)
MERGSHSKTAVGGAFIRAYHLDHDEDMIFADSLAHLLITPAERDAFETLYIAALAKLAPDLAASSSDRTVLVGHAVRSGVSGAVFLARARYIEDKLAEAIRRGVRQYVVIGAGFDTFAFRRPSGTQLQIFELDHPDTQALKQERLARAGFVTPADLHYVAADLERESVAAALERAQFDANALTVFAWPGVTMYLTRDAILSTLRSVRGIAIGGSELLFDYLEADAFKPARASDRIRLLMESTRRMGEPMLSGFEPESLRSELASLGFDLTEDLGPVELGDRYFKSRCDGLQAPDHFHFARALVGQA